jgi:hypothetical protein
MGSPDRVYQCSLVLALATITIVSFLLANDHKWMRWLILLDVVFDPFIEVSQVPFEQDPILFIEDVPHY